MLFTIIVLVVVAALVVYATKKKKTTTSLHVEETIATPSIHEEIAKTVEEAKNLAPITDATKPAKKKTTPKAAKVETSTPAPTMSAKKKIAPKAKKTNA